jgi:UDP-2-acetamido-2-deoxy-ribo-hexuluronate aminotransferase
MKINFIDLKAQYQEYKDEINKEVLEVMSSAMFIGGKQLNSLEKNLSDYTGAKEVIGCSSGTDALLLSLMALDIKAGDEVITTPFTFIATAEVIAFLGAKTVFVDIDEKTYNIDTSLIEEAITPKTKAIIPVSLYGQCSDMSEINSIASRYNIPVIEDACQSFGATYDGKKSCNLSTIGCTSFFPSKPLGAYGDGGAIFTNDEKIASKIRMLLNHGQNERYKHKYIGINARLDAMQAAVLNVKLRYFTKRSN